MLLDFKPTWSSTLRAVCSALHSQQSSMTALSHIEYQVYESQNPAALNNSQDIQTDIHNQDIYTHPTRSYLLVEGRLSSTGDAYTAATLISLINNAIYHTCSLGYAIT